MSKMNPSKVDNNNSSEHNLFDLVSIKLFYFFLAILACLIISQGFKMAGYDALGYCLFFIFFTITMMVSFSSYILGKVLTHFNKFILLNLLHKKIYLEIESFNIFSFEISRLCLIYNDNKVFQIDHIKLIVSLKVGNFFHISARSLFSIKASCFSCTISYLSLIQMLKIVLNKKTRTRSDPSDTSQSQKKIRLLNRIIWLFSLFVLDLGNLLIILHVENEKIIITLKDIYLSCAVQDCKLISYKFLEPRVSVSTMAISLEKEKYIQSFLSIKNMKMFFGSIIFMGNKLTPLTKCSCIDKYLVYENNRIYSIDPFQEGYCSIDFCGLSITFNLFKVIKNILGVIQDLIIIEQSKNVSNRSDPIKKKSPRHVHLHGHKSNDVPFNITTNYSFQHSQKSYDDTCTGSLYCKNNLCFLQETNENSSYNNYYYVHTNHPLLRSNSVDTGELNPSNTNFEPLKYESPKLILETYLEYILNLLPREFIFKNPRFSVSILNDTNPSETNRNSKSHGFMNFTSSIIISFCINSWSKNPMMKQFSLDNSFTESIKKSVIYEKSLIRDCLMIYVNFSDFHILLDYISDNQVEKYLHTNKIQKINSPQNSNQSVLSLKSIEIRFKLDLSLYDIKYGIREIESFENSTKLKTDKSRSIYFAFLHEPFFSRTISRENVLKNLFVKYNINRNFSDLQNGFFSTIHSSEKLSHGEFSDSFKKYSKLFSAIPLKHHHGTELNCVIQLTKCMVKLDNSFWNSLDSLLFFIHVLRDIRSNPTFNQEHHSDQGDSLICLNSRLKQRTSFNDASSLFFFEMQRLCSSDQSFISLIRKGSFELLLDSLEASFYSGISQSKHDLVCYSFNLNLLEISANLSQIYPFNTDLFSPLFNKSHNFFM